MSNNPLRAYNISFKKEVNGSFSLTFDMAYKYHDVETGKLLDNPYIKLLVNERKVKLLYKKKWYDFLIKEINEDSATGVFSYTANALFINELSKTGNSIELDIELENNIGTITELAENILEGTGWRVDNDSEILRSYNEEQLYEILLNKPIAAYPIDFSAKDGIGAQPITIAKNEKIYVFFSSLTDETLDFQIIYREDGAYEMDDDHIVLNAQNYIIKEIENKDSEGAIYPVNPDFALNCNFSEMRGKRIVRKPLTKFLPKLGVMVDVCRNQNDEEIYCYKKSEYITSSTVNNYLVNGSEFLNREYWHEPGTSKITLTTIEDKNNVLKVDFKTGGILNSSLGLKTVLNDFENGFQEGQKFILSVRSDKIDNLSFAIKTYERTADGYQEDKELFKFSPTAADQIKEKGASDADKYLNFNRRYMVAECKTTISHQDLMDLNKNQKGLGLFITSSTQQIVQFEEIYFFDYIIDEDDERIIAPDDIIQSKIKTKHYYFYPEQNKDAESIEELELIQAASYEENPSYPPKFDEKCEKIRTISATESNCFNLIQDLCETFECWAIFNIEHEEDGKVKLDENYRPIKSVLFKEYVGKDNFVGFKYGINLKGIQRQIQSDTIITKMIVKDNSNEFGVDGFCSIARASENPTQENFVLDFSYFTNQLLLDYNALQADLYNVNLNAGSLGYISQLSHENRDKNKLIEERSQLFIESSQLEADITVYQERLNAALEDLEEWEVDLEESVGLTWAQVQNSTDAVLLKQDKVIQAKAAIPQLEKIRDVSTAQLDGLQKRFQECEQLYKDKTDELEEIKKRVQTLTDDFNQKYYQYVQEGAWISEDYIDDNLYYFDALSTLHTSSQPQITYTVDVVEISAVDGYQNYDFDIGDKTFIEDTTFFGWVVKDGYTTPRREEVIISEIEINLDNPDTSKITIQNYKTQFEDLFQRITATTTSIEFSTGKYEKASSIIDENGNIKPTVLESSMINNNFIISNAKDESVVIDDQGITATNLYDPSKAIRIVSGGLFLTQDGGQTWTTGISGYGINANCLTTGRVDTQTITIGDSAFPHFRWDKNGLTAYSVSKKEDFVNYNFSTFVRFDQYGLYGIKGQEGFIATGEQSIIDNALFSLTWSGFHIKTTGNGSSGIEITSENDIRVLGEIPGAETRGIASAPELIKIGRLDKNGNVGIRISNKEGNAVIETNNDGTLWLKNRLSISANKNTVAIGYLGINESEEKARVFEAGKNGEESNFVVWEDGSIRANNGSFKGHIEADSGYFSGELKAATGSFSGHVDASSGTIGGVNILAIQNLGYRVVIESDKGYIVDFDEEELASEIALLAEEDSGETSEEPIERKVTLVAKVYNGPEEYLPEKGFTYQWYDNGEVLEGENRQQLILDFSDREKYYIQVEVTEVE